MRHTLSNIKDNFATCSVCGPNTPLKSNYRGGFRCRKKYDENRKRARDRGSIKLYSVEQKYGGEPRTEIVNRLLPKQNNRCAICLDEFVRSPHVDHDHKTGKIRGLLCSRCNMGIGLLRDDVVIMKNAMVYLNQ